MLHITPRERAALQLLANGNPTHEIAGRLGVSEGQVEAQLMLLFWRMGAATRTEAIDAAWRRGLLTCASEEDARLSGKELAVGQG
jgi:DNA-binding NarL/FixJ family response regulator